LVPIETKALIVLLALLPACGGSAGGSANGPCGDNGACPSGYTCDGTTNVCRVTGSSADAPRPDASVPDAPAPDAGPPCNLVVNGGFELPAIAPNADVYSTSPTYLPGWTLAAGGNQFFQENGEPFQRPRFSQGAQAICLNSDGAPNIYVEQTFATKVGKPYTVSFSMTDEQGAGPSGTAVKVDVAGVTQTFTRAADTGYARKSLNFVATGASTTLRISDATPSNLPLNSPFIDDVFIACDGI
jgi:Protein of unknown function (DUF642)